MTYFEFLIRFLCTPLLILGAITIWDWRCGRRLPASLRSWPAAAVIAAHIVVAVVYTTPWDNYLVATRVWWYEPSLVSGVIIGWVPLEEYLFFVLQTLMTSLWLLILARRLGPLDKPFDAADPAARRGRWIGSAVVAAAFAGGALILLLGWRPGTYLGLELVWACLPILLQMVFGGDILWHYRKLVAWALIPSWLYLCLADFLAIGLGTWIIAPDQSVGLAVGHLPLEEIVFFLVTNMLVVFGTVLVLARESQARAPRSLLNAMHKWMPAPADTVSTP